MSGDANEVASGPDGLDWPYINLEVDAAIAVTATQVLSSRLVEAELDPVAVDAGRLAGRVEVLLWCQAELQLELAQLEATDRFADTRQLENFLSRVRDSLKAVQDGSGAWAGLVRSAVEPLGLGGTADRAVPDEEMGG